MNAPASAGSTTNAYATKLVPIIFWAIDPSWSAAKHI